MKTPSLRMSRSLWRRLTFEVRKRGNGVQESGAFLLGEIQGTRIKHFIAFDDLDERALSSGIISFHSIGFVQLWNFCTKHRMQVLADVHTHGGVWTGQSETDRVNPMVETPGHMALILPNFGATSHRSLKGVGIYEYLGDHRWKSWDPRSGRVKLTIL
jgi:hypothetical protein